MSERLDVASLTAAPYKAMVALDRSITLEVRLRHLLEIRASQINRCAFWIDMHWKDARAAGESEDRLYMLSAWSESAEYTDREKAALALCEAMTLIATSHVPEEVWRRVSSHFDQEELAQLIFAITAINAWNRIAITSEAWKRGSMHASSIRPATAADLQRLVAVEVEAGQVFRTVGMAQVAEHVPQVSDLREAVEAERLWVTQVGSEVAGYITGEVLDGNAHVAQVSVGPDYAGRGLGRAMIEFV